MIRVVLSLVLSLSTLFAASTSWADEVRLRDLGRFQGVRETSLVGYGIVTGLTGTGDSPRNPVTQQALSNALGRLGSSVSPLDIRSRNVAAVMITATLPSSADAGDRIDVHVTSIGDARSLAGGILLMTQLVGPDQQVYGLAQGPVVVGGFQFSGGQSSEQRNFPGAGLISEGGLIEVSLTPTVMGEGRLTFLLRDPNVTTAVRVADAVNSALGPGLATVRDADTIEISTQGASDLFRLMSRIESLLIDPAATSRVIINERSGTVVAGGDVRISSVVVSQGGVRVSISADNAASQPLLIGGYAPEVRSLVVTNTTVEVRDDESAVVTLPNTTVADLIDALSRASVSTRGQISILQAIHAAGALHADLIVQ